MFSMFNFNYLVKTNLISQYLNVLFLCVVIFSYTIFKSINIKEVNFYDVIYLKKYL